MVVGHFDELISNPSLGEKFVMFENLTKRSKPLGLKMCSQMDLTDGILFFSVLIPISLNYLCPARQNRRTPYGFLVLSFLESTGIMSRVAGPFQREKNVSAPGFEPAPLHCSLI